MYLAGEITMVDREFLPSATIMSLVGVVPMADMEFVTLPFDVPVGVKEIIAKEGVLAATIMYLVGVMVPGSWCPAPP
jgi:hypothetical protein